MASLSHSTTCKTQTNNSGRVNDKELQGIWVFGNHGGTRSGSLSGVPSLDISAPQFSSDSMRLSGLKNISHTVKRLWSQENWLNKSKFQCLSTVSSDLRKHIVPVHAQGPVISGFINGLFQWLLSQFNDSYVRTHLWTQHLGYWGKTFASTRPAWTFEIPKPARHGLRKIISAPGRWRQVVEWGVQGILNRTESMRPAQAICLWQ